MGLRAGNFVRLQVLQEAATLKEPSLQRRIHHRGVKRGAGGSCCISFAMCASTLLQLTENCSPKVSMSGASHSPRILPGSNPLVRLKGLGMVEIVVHQGGPRLDTEAGKHWKSVGSLSVQLFSSPLSDKEFFIPPLGTNFNLIVRRHVAAYPIQNPSVGLLRGLPEEPVRLSHEIAVLGIG